MVDAVEQMRQAGRDYVKNKSLPTYDKVYSGKGGNDSLYKVTNPDGTITYTSYPDRYTEVYSGGGGRGSSSSAAAKAADRANKLDNKKIEQAEEAKKTAQELRNKQLVDTMRLGGSERINKQNERIKAEQEKIERLRTKILAQDGKEQVGTYKDVKTGDTQEIKRLKRGSDTIVEVKNIDTGVTTTTTYGVGKAGGGVRATGGIKIKEEKTEPVQDNLFFNKIEEAKKEGERKLNMLKGDGIYYSQDVDRTGQIYSPQSNMFLASAYEMGDGGTAIMTPPTPKEQTKIDLSNVPVSKKVEENFNKGIELLRNVEIIKKGREKIDKSGIKEVLNKTETFLESKRIPESEQPFFSPSNVKKAYDYAAEKNLQAAEFGNELLIKTKIVKEDSLLNKPLSISREDVKEFTSQTYMFASLIPFTPSTKNAQDSLRARRLQDYNKYVRQSEKLVELKAEKISSSPKRVAIQGTEGRYVNIEGGRRIKFKQKIKGSVNLENQKLTGNWYGEIEETQAGGLFRKPKTYKGKAKIVDGVYSEEIAYGKNIRRVTETNLKGEGVSKVYKRDKLVSEIDLAKSESPDFNVKSYSDKQKVEVNIDGKIEGSKSGLATKETKGTLQFGKDTKRGISRRVETSNQIIDIARAKPKLRIESTKINGKGIKDVKKTSQKLIYDEGTPEKIKDTIGFTKFGEEEKLLKTVQGDIDRVISRKQDIKIVTIFENPKIKKVPKKTINKPKLEYDEKSFLNIENGKVVDTPKIKGEITLGENLPRPARTKLEYDEKSFLNIENGKVVDRKEITGMVTKGDDILQYRKIPRPQKYLEDTKKAVSPDIPVIPAIEIESVSGGGTKFRGIGINTNKPSQKSTVTQIKPQEIVFNAQKVSIQQPMQETEKISLLKPMEKSRSKSKTKQKETQLEATSQIQKQDQKQEQILKQVLKTQSIQKQQQATEQIFKNQLVGQPKAPQPKTPKPTIPKPSGLAKRILQKVEQEQEPFEAFILKGGKQVSIAKGSKEKVTSKLSKQLKGELAASGFLTKGGKKLKASETGLLKDTEFRVGKKDIYKVVEKKTKRLRKKGTGILIQPFRKQSSKKSKNKWLLGI